MRRMSFQHTTDAVRARTKTVTRRTGWRFAKVGDRYLAVDKLRTKNAELIAVVEVVSVRREPLFDLIRAADGFGCDGGGENPYAIAEMAREGFPGMKPLDFIEMFTNANRGNGLSVYANNVDVTRIEFCYRGDPECEYCGGRGLRFWHTAKCYSEDCVLAAGLYDCAGETDVCPCVFDQPKGAAGVSA